MKHPTFNLVDYARGDVRRRNNIVQISEALADRKNGGAFNSYITVYRFDDGYFEHCRTHKGVGGYAGPAYADYLPIDVDREGDLAGALRSALRIAVTIHETYDVRQDQVRYFFSGAKGYHLLIPTQLMGDVQPSKHLPAAFRSMALGIADVADEVIDGKIYDLNRLFRLPDTQHGTSGLWKVELTWDEFSTLGVDGHRELAAQPRFLPWRPHDLEPVDALAEYYAKHILEAETHRERRASGDDASVRRMSLVLMPSYGKPNRHNLVLAFSGYAAKRHMPREAALGVVEYLAAEDDELADRLRAVEDTYDKVRQGQQVRGFTELAALMPPQDLADVKDLLGDRSATAAPEATPEPSGRVSLDHVYDAQRAGETYLRYARELVNRRISIGIPTLDRRLRGLMPGTVTTLLAKARIGKSLFAQQVRRNVGRSTRDGCTVFFSLEMPIELVWERDAQHALERQGHDVERTMREASEGEAQQLIVDVSRTIPRSYTVTAPNISLDEMGEYCDLITGQYGQQVVCVIVDYLSLIRSPGRDLYTSTSLAARGMKTFAKQLKAPVIMLCQVRRRGADGSGKIDGSTPPSLEDARDSGAIEEGSDSVIGAWRPDLDQDTDRELHLRILKNRVSSAGGQDIRCRVDWRRLSVLEIAEETATRDWTDAVAP